MSLTSGFLLCSFLIILHLRASSSPFVFFCSNCSSEFLEAGCTWSVTPGLEKGRQWTDFLPDSRGHSLPYDREWLPQLPQTDHWTVESLPVQSQRSLNKVFSLGRVSRGEMSHQKQNGNNTTGLAQILLKSGLR